MDIAITTATTAATMMDSGAIPVTTILQLLLELGWVAVGFVLYFLLQVAFLPWAQVYYLKALGVVTPKTATPKTCDPADEEESGSEHEDASDKDSSEGVPAIARPVVEALEAARQLSATVKTDDKTSPQVAEKKVDTTITTPQLQGPPGHGRSGRRTGMQRGGAGGFFAGRREERLAYVRGYQPKQSQQLQQPQPQPQPQQQQQQQPFHRLLAAGADAEKEMRLRRGGGGGFFGGRREERLAYVSGFRPDESQQQQQQQVSPPASPSCSFLKQQEPGTPKKKSPRTEALSTKKLQRINNSSNGLLQQAEQLPRNQQSPKPSMEDHFLLNLWKEAMAPPQSPSHSSREGSDVE